MIYLILCIIINGLIGVIFKLFGKYDVNTLHAILINYAVCVFSGMIFIGDFGFLVDVFHKGWVYVSIGLGLCFIIIFNAYAKAVQQSGVGLATIFQKMALIAPVIVAIGFYGDEISIYKIIGLILSIASLFLLSMQGKGSSNGIRKGLGILLLVFLGSAVIDLMLYIVEVENLAPGADVRFVSSLFFFAMVFGLVFLLLSPKERKVKLTKRSLIAGIFLGIPNFFSIYLLLKVISLGWEGSVVFPANNVGVLTIAALFGVFMFKEEVTTRKILGFVCALSAIIFLSINS